MKRTYTYFFLIFAFAILAGCETSYKPIVTDESGIVHTTFKGDLLFDTGSATIKKGSGKLLDQLVPELQKSQGKFTVQGHTDSRGTYDGNMKLSQKRADAVKDALVKRGIDPKRIRAKGYGSSRPVVKDAVTPAEYQQNRRVVIIFMEDTTDPTN